MEALELRINQLTKQYKSKTAVNNLSVTLTPGIYGLLGANGAGKTTLMRMLCDILDPTSGSITYNGMDIRQAGSSYRNRIGYLPQDFGYYPNMTAPDFLLYVAALKHLPSDEASARTGTLLKAVGLSDIGKKKIKTFSGGMKQRLGIAQTFLNDPAVLILDEPTAGLDPKERIRFRNMIQDFSAKRIILFSTHIVSDIEHIATDILIMKEGSLLYKGRPQDISTTLEDFLATDFVMERLVDDYGVLHSVKDLTGMDELPRLEMADFYVETVHDIGSSMMFLFLIAAVIFSTIYADEGSTRMDRIILSSGFGKEKIGPAKCIMSFLLMTGLFLVSLMIIVIKNFIIFPVNGFDVSMSALVNGMEGISISIGQMMILAIFVSYAGLLLSGFTAFILSSGLTSFAAIIISIVVILAPSMISVYEKGISTVLIGFFPIRYVQFYGMMTYLPGNQAVWTYAVYGMASLLLATLFACGSVKIFRSRQIT